MQDLIYSLLGGAKWYDTRGVVDAVNSDTRSADKPKKERMQASGGSSDFEVRIPENEYRLTFSRSGGPGGQNVNKVESRVELRWKYIESEVLGEQQKRRLEMSRQFRNKINAEGEIVLHESGSRQQSVNRGAVIEKLHRLLCVALRPQKRRKRTGIPKGSKEKRLKNKKALQKKKSDRKKPRGEKL